MKNINVSKSDDNISDNMTSKINISTAREFWYLFEAAAPSWVLLKQPCHGYMNEWGWEANQE